MKADCSYLPTRYLPCMLWVLVPLFSFHDWSLLWPSSTSTYWELHEPRTLHKISMCSIMELHPEHNVCHLQTYSINRERGQEEDEHVLSQPCGRRPLFHYLFSFFSPTLSCTFRNSKILNVAYKAFIFQGLVPASLPTQTLCLISSHSSNTTYHPLLVFRPTPFLPQLILWISDPSISSSEKWNSAVNYL